MCIFIGNQEGMWAILIAVIAHSWITEYFHFPLHKFLYFLMLLHQNCRNFTIKNAINYNVFFSKKNKKSKWNYLLIIITNISYIFILYIITLNIFNIFKYLIVYHLIYT